jgi:radical SAM protein with 4Fe4S-binding SPASM domain
LHGSRARPRQNDVLRWSTRRAAAKPENVMDSAMNVRAMIDLALMNFSYLIGLEKLAYRPLLVNIEPTNFCNLRCPMCPVSQAPHSGAVARGLMSREVFTAIVKKISAFRPAVALNLGGESLLHPDLIWMVLQLKARGLYAFLDTNACLLTPDKTDELLCSGIDEIVLCLDGRTPSEYELMRKRSSFSATAEKIGLLLRRRSELQMSSPGLPRVVVKNIQFFDGSAARLQPPSAYVSLFADHPPDEWRCTYADYWPGRHRSALTHEYEVEPFGSKYRRCINLWKMLAVSWDAKVYICCLDLNRTVPVGNLLEQDVWKIWNGSELAKFRRIHRRGNQAEIGLCSNCNQIRRERPAVTGFFAAAATVNTRWTRLNNPSEQ